VTALAEVVLWTRDMERSLGFYRDLLGLEDIAPPELPNRFLSAGDGPGGVPMMIVLIPHPEGAAVVFSPEKKRRVLHHLALSATREGYDDLERRCRDAGLDVRGGQHPVLKGVRTFYIDDPDGNEVEVISPA
jgi:catechol 2,3-dioxygenase